MKLAWKMIIVILLLGAPAAFYFQSDYFPADHSAGKQWRAEDFTRFDRQNPLGKDKVSEGQLSVGLKKIHGVRVIYLGENSLLKKLGFRVGDLLAEVNAKPVKELADLIPALHGFLAGAPVFVEFYRHHKKETFAAKLM